jgi:hypothetical protein
MHKEMLKASDNKRTNPVIFTTLLVVFLMILIGLSNLAYKRWGTSYVSYAVFLVFVAAGFYVYKRKILEYHYSLVDQQLIFSQAVGKRKKDLLHIQLKHIIRIYPLYAEEPSYKSKVNSNYYFNFNRRSQKAYVIIARCNGEICRIIFEPTPVLVRLLKESITNKQILF